MFHYLWDAFCLASRLSWVFLNGIVFGGLSLFLFLQIRYSVFTCATLLPVPGYDDIPGEREN